MIQYYINTLPYSLILCFADMCSAWFSLDCYSIISNKKYPGFSLSAEVRHCLRRMALVIESHQQKAYTLFKMWPSLVIGSILRDVELAPEFLTTITEDLTPSLKATEFFRAETCTVQSPTHAMMKLEIAGMWKTMGHPVINMDKSTESWIKKCTVLKRNLEPAAVSISCMFKKEFCRQYYKTHKRWPKVEALKDIYIHIISDKAIIPCRSEWIHEYDGKAFRTMHGRFPSGPSPSTKSVVIHYLTTEVFETALRLQGDP